MNRNIEDWKVLIRAVFVAEDNIMPQWEDRQLIQVLLRLLMVHLR